VGQYKVNLKVDKENNVFVNCDCGFWQYQGPEYHAVQKNYLLGKPKGTASKPVEKDPQENNLLCKHTYAVLENVFKV
jgi:hypothetical protein